MVHREEATTQRELYYTATVHTEEDLLRHAQSYTTVVLAADIMLSSTLVIAAKTKLVIRGDGHKIDGQGLHGCFIIRDSEVELRDVVVTRGNAITVSGGSTIINNHNIYQNQIVV